MPTCPKCNGPVWDERKSRYYGTGIAASGKPKPIFKCQDKSCNGAIWQETDEFDQRPPSERRKPTAYKQAKAAMQDNDDQPPVDGLPAAGIELTRRHLMQSANLYNLCVKAVNIAIAPYVPEKLQTEEWLQAAVASLWIEASGRRSNDNVTWFSYIDHMPEKPIEKE